jgi:3,4-dihydroxy 2-butanone 4-phosphate synthase/GTP cyclohydrolase II
MSVLIRTEEAIAEIKKGRIVILVDDQDHQITGNLTTAAEKATHEAIDFMNRHGKGSVYLSLPPEKFPSHEPALTVAGIKSGNGASVSVSHGGANGSAGFAAPGRAATILKAADRNTAPRNLISSDYFRPLLASSGGVLVRAGQAEGSMDLARLAGFAPAGVICEVSTHNGNMSRLRELVSMAEKHGLKICTIRDLIKYRMRTERLVRPRTQTMLSTEFSGDFRLIIYENDVDEHSHVALVKGEIDTDEPVLVRVHSQCLTGDVFGSRRCDCGPQLDKAMRMVGKAGKGVILYMQQEGRGIGLLNKIKAYALQDQGCDTVEANIRLGFEPDLRDYGIGAQMLADLGVRKMRLMTNNPAKIAGLQRYGLEVVEQVPIVIEPCAMNVRYLTTKRDKMGHLYDIISS